MSPGYGKTGQMGRSGPSAAHSAQFSISCATSYVPTRYLWERVKSFIVTAPPHVDKTRKRWRGSFPLSKQPSSPKTSLGDTSFSLGARTAAYFWLNSVGGYLLPSAPTRAISRYISAPKCKVVASDSVGRSDIRHRLRCGVGGGVSIALAPFFSLLACLLFQFFSLEPRWRGK